MSLQIVFNILLATASAFTTMEQTIGEKVGCKEREVVIFEQNSDFFSPTKLNAQCQDRRYICSRSKESSDMNCTYVGKPLRIVDPKAEDLGNKKKQSFEAFVNELNDKSAKQKKTAN